MTLTYLDQKVNHFLKTKISSDKCEIKKHYIPAKNEDVKILMLRCLGWNWNNCNYCALNNYKIVYSHILSMKGPVHTFY